MRTKVKAPLKERLRKVSWLTHQWMRVTNHPKISRVSPSVAVVFMDDPGVPSVRETPAGLRKTISISAETKDALLVEAAKKAVLSAAKLKR